MFYYARSDTHFLLYIFDNIRNELIDRSNPEVPDENRMELVLQRSKETSLYRYERHVYNAESGKGPGGWFSQLVKSPVLLSNEQFAVFKAVHEWRDRVARQDDDSPHFVLSQQAILSIAKLMPGDMAALFGLARPVSQGLKSRARDLLALIKDARARGQSGPAMIDVLRPRPEGSNSKPKAPTVSPEPTSKTLVAVMDEGELRSDNSTFWGGAFGSSMWDGPKPASKDNLRLAVPLPPLNSEIFGVPQGFAEQAQIATETPLPASPPPTREKKVDEPFVIKRGAKRKSEVISDADETGGEFDISLDVEEDDDIREKAVVKAQRKAEKRARKAAKKAAQAAEVLDNAGDMDVDGDEEDGDEAFDYSKAEPVLHGKRDGDKGGRRKKPMDPYIKSMDAPKGMRRLQTERAGRSHTFKS